ncbi:hypothetical protein D3C76_1367200 [compost metagenome]
MNAGVLRHIGDGVSQHTIYRISNVLVRRLEGTFNRVACAVVFVHFIAVLRGSDDGDIGFGGDIVTHVALRNVGIQIVHNDLQINCTAWADHITTRSHLFFQNFLQQETQVAGGCERDLLVIASHFCQRLILTLIGSVDAHGNAHQAWVLLWQSNFWRDVNGGWRSGTTSQHEECYQRKEEFF